MKHKTLYINYSRCAMCGELSTQKYMGKFYCQKHLNDKLGINLKLHDLPRYTQYGKKIEENLEPEFIPDYFQLGLLVDFLKLDFRKRIKRNAKRRKSKTAGAIFVIKNNGVNFIIYWNRRDYYRLIKAVGEFGEIKINYEIRD